MEAPSAHPAAILTPHPPYLQEHGSPSPFWEQELESLHFVIEMKNEHIHGLDKKLLNLESVVGSRGCADGFCSFYLLIFT